MTHFEGQVKALFLRNKQLVAGSIQSLADSQSGCTTRALLIPMTTIQADLCHYQATANNKHCLQLSLQNTAHKHDKGIVQRNMFTIHQLYLINVTPVASTIIVLPQCCVPFMSNSFFTVTSDPNDSDVKRLLCAPIRIANCSLGYLGS